MKRSWQTFTLLLSPVLCGLLILSGVADYLTPSRITMNSPSEELLPGNYPLSLRYETDQTVTAAAESAAQEASSSLKATLIMFGFLPVKEVQVTVQDHKEVLVGGQPFGLRLYTDGLVVSSTESVSSGSGVSNPADEAGIRAGDTLLSADGISLTANEQLAALVAGSNGKSIRLKVRRDGEVFNTRITPVADREQKTWRIGLGIRDSIAGIGTLTYIDPVNHSFAGLGHGLCDSRSGLLMPLMEGDVVAADITSVDKSTAGCPGSLCGSFSSSSPKGSLLLNSDRGVYGCLCGDIPAGETVPIAFKQEVVRGEAEMLTTIAGRKPERYRVVIEDISYNDRNSCRNMVIRITDERLLQHTGGIVQGMNGSPILQNGRLAGALTHVFVNDPSRGYGVFAESMTSLSDSMVPAA